MIFFLIQKVKLFFYAMFGNLEGEETRGEMRVEENGYPPSYLNVSKIKYKGWE